MSRIVAALGGNALIRRGQAGSTEVQRANVRTAARAIVALEADGHELVVSHGNGPQVGFLAIEAEAARDVVEPPPLDVLVAESQGQIGYLLAEALERELAATRHRRPVAVLLTETIVDPADPAFARPTKPIGPIYDRAAAEALAARHGWAIGPDGAAWRRVVASPRPIGIVQAASIRALVSAGILVVASGGGGIPVATEPGGGHRGLEAVVDKDLAAVELAVVVNADALLLLTDVDGVYDTWAGRPAGAAGRAGAPIRRLSLEDAARGIHDGTFANGSMGPKVEAAAAFVRRTGRWAAIGALDDAVNVLAGRSGTRIVASGGRRPTRIERRRGSPAPVAV